MRLDIEPSQRDFLRRHGLETFSDFMVRGKGRVLKEREGRTILRLELPAEEGMRTFFMKRHLGIPRLGDLFRALLSGFPLTWGRKEWAVIRGFRGCGIPTPDPVAAGERRSFLRWESFVMTAALEGFRPLDGWIRDRFTPPLSRERIAEKRGLIREVARLARTMHRAGFNHRDYYLCHLFIREAPEGGWDLRVLDLQRVDRRRWFRERWIVKDLAALNYSAPVPMITRTDRLRFLAHYLAEDRIPARRASLIRQTIRKTERILRHDEKLKHRRGGPLQRGEEASP